jgi:hypothetical protein
MKRILAWIAAGLLGAGLVFAGGMAFAGGGSDTVQACYHNNTGALRVDVAGTGCRSNETAIAFDGMAPVTRIVQADRTLPEDGFGGIAAECDHGEVVLGGGFEIASINPETVVVTNAPIVLGDGRHSWQVTVNAGGPVPISAFAVCAPGVAVAGW